MDNYYYHRDRIISLPDIVIRVESDSVRVTPGTDQCEQVSTAPGHSPGVTPVLTQRTEH